MTVIRSIDELIAAHDGRVTVACDTEFKGPHTLTLQCAARLRDGSLAIQLYHSPVVPAPPRKFDVKHYLPGSLQTQGQSCDRVVLCTVKPLTDELSPRRILADVLDLRGVEVIARAS